MNNIILKLMTHFINLSTIEPELPINSAKPSLISTYTHLRGDRYQSAIFTERFNYLLHSKRTYNQPWTIQFKNCPQRANLSSNSLV